MSSPKTHQPSSRSSSADAFVFPASFAQQRLWFLNQLEAASAVYNISRVVRIQSWLDASVFERSVRELARRHESLRTTFQAEAGEPYQVVSREETVLFAYRDLSGLEEEQRARETKLEVEANARKPFDLARGPLFRTALLRLSQDDHVFLFAIHHIVADGWSLGILFGELSEIYDAFLRGEPSPLPPLPLQYADYAVWQREWMQGQRLQEGLDYWRKALRGAPALLELPTDFPRPAIQTSRGTSARSSIDADLAGLVREFSRRERVTVFMTLLGAFQTLLSRYSGQDDVVVGTPVAGRNRVETESVVGLFANTVALRTDLSGDPSFREVVRRVRETTLEAYGHQEVPFERVVEALQPRRNLSHGPIVQVFFALENTQGGTSRLFGPSVSPNEAEGQVARADVAVFMREEGGAFPFEVEFNVDLFERESIESLASHFRTLLASAVAEPDRPVSRLPLVTPDERGRIVESSRGPVHPPAPRATIPALFEGVVRRRSEEVAVVDGGARLTYGELNERANRLAHAMRARGIGPGALVAVCARRSLESVVAILGVLKSGAAYVPIDPSYPTDRISYLLEDSGARLLLADDSGAQGSSAAGLAILRLDETSPEIERQSAADLAPLAGPDDLAYAIYTSGSTGKPKGVLVEHAAVANLFSGTREELGFGEDDVWTIFHSLAFDLSVWELWGPLLHGGRLVIVPVEVTRAPLELGRLIADEGVTVLSQTPAGARRLALARKDPRSRASEWRLRTLVCGGEALPSDLAAELLSWDVPLWNFYGPTEATVWTTIKRVGPPDCAGGFVSVGRPIANAAAYVLDRHLEPVPRGVAGDLHLGGAGLARGYLGREELNRERFVADPFSPPGDAPARLYRTGDRARRNRLDDIDFLGRDDDQVKIRGYRVELGEIEAALSEHPQISEAAVLVREEEPGDQRVVAYFAPKPGHIPSTAELRSHLSERLPEYMIPQVFMALAALPLTSNGKVDRRALPAPGGERPSVERPFTAARTETEEKLAEVWRRLLGLDRVGRDDNFFELGGHSLKATQAIARAEELFGIDLPLRTLFETPTVAGLARRIEERLEEAEPRGRETIPRVDRTRPLPVSFGQQRLWFMDQLEPGGSSYNISRGLRIRGALNREALAEALHAIGVRHESLRTTFLEVEGTPRQLVSPEVSARLEQRDLGSVKDAGSRERELVRVVSEEVSRPFDLARGPLWRSLLIRVGPAEHVLLLMVHHIVADGWSFGILFEELGRFYSGRVSGRSGDLPELAIQYPDYAAWQRDSLRGERLERLSGYWRARLAGAPETLMLPGRRRRERPGSNGAFVRRVLSAELTSSIDALAHREGTTRFTSILAVFQALLSQEGGSRDVVVGTDVANRDRIETEKLIGFFVNLLPIRTDLSGNPRFREALARARESALGAYAHQDLPFEKLVEELRPVRALGVNPLVQVLIVQSPSVGAFQLSGLLVEEYPIPIESSRFDLVLFVGEMDKRVRLSWLYDRDLFEADRIAQLADRFEGLLAAVLADPDTRLEALERATDAGKEPDAMDKNERRKAQASRLRGTRRQGVDLARAGEVSTGYLTESGSLPLVVSPAEGGELDLANWAASRREFIETKLLEHGAILFRGFGVGSAAEFERFASGLCPELFGEYGDLPREAVGGKVYGSTPYPSDQPILFHNESSHMHRWPMKIWFFCVTPSAQGGETPIVDCRRVYERLDPALQRAFAEKGLMYVRNYTEGLDVSWESFYGTSDRAKVEDLCRRAGTELEWRPDNGLRTRQRCPAVIRHPQTGELAFFNQLQLHHVSCLDPAVRESLSALMSRDDLPRNVYWGDGSVIEDSVMADVGGVYREAAVAFPWRSGDVLMLNNMLVAHSRNPYVGERKIVVAMAEMVNQSEVSGR